MMTDRYTLAVIIQELERSGCVMCRKSAQKLRAWLKTAEPAAGTRRV